MDDKQFKAIMAGIESHCLNQLGTTFDTQEVIDALEAAMMNERGRYIRDKLPMGARDKAFMLSMLKNPVKKEVKVEKPKAKAKVKLKRVAPISKGPGDSEEGSKG